MGRQGYSYFDQHLRHEYIYACVYVYVGFLGQYKRKVASIALVSLSELL